MIVSVSSKVSLALCLCLVFQQSAGAQLFGRAKTGRKPISTALGIGVNDQTEAAAWSVESGNASVDLAAYNSFEPTGIDGAGCQQDDAETFYIDDSSSGPSEFPYTDFCDSSPDCRGCCDGPKFLLKRSGQFFFVGEYIYARASLSEALAYVITDSNQPQLGAEFVEFDFDHNASYRFSGGYRLCDCDAEIAFHFARYRSEADFSVDDNQVSLQIFSPYGIDIPTNGGTLTGNADIDLRSYDLGISRTIPLGGLMGCCDCGCDPCCEECCDSCCGDCCDSCCGWWCPAWDITWSAGVRFADAGWSRSTSAFATGVSNRIDTATTRLEFEGAGARVGLLGRRYFGCNGWVSFYAKGDISLLVGNMNIQTITIDDPDGSAPTQAISHRNSGRRMIPVTEIEAGLTAHLGNHLNLSSGYFLAAWHDLGFRDEYDFTFGPGGFQLSHYDDANILGFDGFFARVEVTY